MDLNSSFCGITISIFRAISTITEIYIQFQKHRRFLMWHIQCSHSLEKYSPYLISLAFWLLNIKIWCNPTIDKWCNFGHTIVRWKIFVVLEFLFNSQSTSRSWLWETCISSVNQPINAIIFPACRKQPCGLCILFTDMRMSGCVSLPDGKCC